MARLIILGVLAVTLALVSGEDQYASYISMSGGLVPIPKVNILWQDLPEAFVNSEEKFLNRCRITTTHWEPEFFQSQYMINYRPRVPNVMEEVKKINAIALGFTNGYNNGTYKSAKANQDIDNLYGIAKKLWLINRDVIKDDALHGRQNEPAGPLIVAICRDMHSIISLIKAVHPTQHGAVEKPKYVSLASVSGEIHIPQGLRIPQKDMSKKFENTENQYLSECHHTTTGTENGLYIQKNSKYLPQIESYINRINGISKEFEQKFEKNAYHYKQFNEHKISLDRIKRQLWQLDANLPNTHKDGREGSLIVEICRDMHRLTSLMVASQIHSPMAASSR